MNDKAYMTYKTHKTHKTTPYIFKIASSARR